MSVTFSVEGSRTQYVACPTCEACYPKCLDNNCQADMDGADSRCYGMGFSIPSHPELNIANESARILLCEILQYEDVDVLCGTLDADDVIRRLSTSNPSQHTRPTSDNQGLDINE